MEAIRSEASKLPTLLGLLSRDVSLVLPVAKACHLLAIDAMPWALWEILAAAFKQRIIPTT